MIFSAEITAQDTSFFFSPGPNASGRMTDVKYDGAGERVSIWYRKDFFRWYQHPIEKEIEAQNNPDLAYRGHFESQVIKAGTVLEYRIFLDLGHDPNNGDTAPGGVPVTYNEVVVMGFLEKPIKTRWYHGFKGAPGGTYYHATVQTPGVRTHVLLQVSQQEPKGGRFGILEFDAPSAWALNLNQEGYEVDLMPRAPGEPAYPREFGANSRYSLVPGVNYYCLVRYSDSAGNWWYDEEKFTTRQRVVTLKGDSIGIDNDGDPFAAGEASFQILFKHGTISSISFFMGHDDFKINTGDTIPLGELMAFDSAAPISEHIWPFPKKPVEKTFGPYAVTPETQDVYIELGGTEYDGPGEADEPASTWVQPAYIYYPVGPQETVTDQTASVTANPLIEGDDFQFTLQYRYSIAYV